MEPMQMEKTWPIRIWNPKIGFSQSGPLNLERIWVQAGFYNLVVPIE